MRDVVQWTAPAPLWPEATAATELSVRRRTLRRPAILRFATDNFMDDYLALMENDPARLSQYIAEPETWRGPMQTPAPVVRKPAFLRPLNRLRLAAEQKKSKALAAQGGALMISGGAPVSPDKPLKLYQPAHQRFYLITACLVCGRAGLPDRALNPARDERASFVIRRMMPPNFLGANGTIDRTQKLPAFDEATWEEYALVTTATGAGWQKVIVAGANTRADALVAGEEQLPLFPVNYTQDDGRRRRVLTGLVPVGKRENYMGAGAVANANNAGADAPPANDYDAPVDPRMMPLWLDVTEPWTRLIERAGASDKMFNPPSLPKTDDEPYDAAAKRDTLKSLREQIQTVSWYVLLDFAKLLEQYLPDVWATVLGTATPALSTAEAALVNALKQTAFDQTTYTKLTNENAAGADELKSLVKGVSYQAQDVVKNLADALKAIKGGTPLNQTKAKKIEDDLEAVSTAYLRNAPDAKWPTFLFPLADTEFEGPLPPKAPNVADDPDRFLKAAARVSNLANLVAAALKEQPATAAAAAAPLPLAAQKVLDTREGWFVVRCVYERPECGPVDPPVVSAPTCAFQLAGFFDPDAPARPIRIAMPLDTSPAGLRKFDKNTAFMISDMLCGQIDRAKGMSLGDLVRSVLPWPLHKDLSAPDKGPCKEPGGSLEFGMICSLSIPIITICALILLMIIVSLLNIIFSWLPYFLICFPLPGISGKKAKG
ncbi:MAG: hypothetical protein QOD28_871 [Acidobacteriota bacterium]|nr:hypothetical protein [Acidobacteriota bacterium]